MRQEAAKESTKEGEKSKAEAQKRKFEEKKAEERALDEKLQKLKMKERHMMYWEKQCLVLMKVERKYMKDSKQAI